LIAKLEARFQGLKANKRSPLESRIEKLQDELAWRMEQYPPDVIDKVMTLIRVCGFYTARALIRRQYPSMHDLIAQAQSLHNDKTDLKRLRKNLLAQQEQEPSDANLTLLRRTITFLKASIAPIKSTPNEVLDLIFQQYIAMNHSVWDLVEVSEQWKHIAFATPSLWNFLIITDPPRAELSSSYNDHDGNVHYFQGRAHVVRTESSLKRLLSLSGGVPLHLAIDYHDGYEGDVHTVEEVIKRVMLAVNAQRIGSLDIQVTCPILAVSNLSCLEQASLRNLQHLTLWGPLPDQWRDLILRSISKNTIHLRSLCIRGEMQRINLPDHIWRRVHVLSVFSAGLDVINQITTRTPHLIQLESVGQAWPDSITPESTLPKLQEVSLNTDPYSIRRLHMPILTVLNIKDSFGISPDTPPEVATLPMVTSMALATDCPHKWLSNISCPMLQSLSLNIKVLF
jgi:hypothetical protein